MKELVFRGQIAEKITGDPKIKVRDGGLEVSFDVYGTPLEALLEFRRKDLEITLKGEGNEERR